MTNFQALENDINNFISKTGVFVRHSENMLIRMQDLMRALGNPEKNLKVIHVAGTSGKTSTCYFIASLLAQTGLKTGLTVSPHVESVRERAMLNLEPLDEKTWAKEISQFFTLVKNSNVKPSYFEFYMAFAFWLFAKHQVDYAVIETGLGGIWDASNVARRPDKICAITDIGYDHMEVLGDTLTEITTKKAGIIHPGNQVFCYRQNYEIMTALKQSTALIGGNLRAVDDNFKNFMVRNFILAQILTEFTLERDHKPTLTHAQIQRAQHIKIPARAEKFLYKNQAIIIDGAHNPQKLAAFVNYTHQNYPANGRIVIASFGSNKIQTLEASIRALRPLSRHIILTSFQDNSIETNRRTSIDAHVMVAAAKKAEFVSIEYIDDPEQALEQAISDHPEQITIAGSFYLLNHLRPLLLNSSPPKEV